MKSTETKGPPTDSVADFFNMLSPRYREQYKSVRTGASFNFHRRLDLAYELASHSSGRLLDCGCGPGEITSALLRSGRFTSATVVDVSTQMLEAARALIPQENSQVPVEFVQSDILELSADLVGTFDLIVCLGVLAHVGRIDELLDRLKTMLRPGGSILFQVTRAEHVGVRIFNLLGGRIYASRHGYRMSYYHSREIERAFERADLRIIDRRRHSLYIPFADKVWPRANYTIERSLREWSSRHGADTIYLLSQRQT